MFSADLTYPAEFIRSFDGSTDIKLWIKLLDEEGKELEEALQGTDRAHVLKEAADVVYVIAPVMVLAQMLYENGMLSDEVRDLAEEKVAFADKYMTAVATMFSEDTVAKALELVHASNMSKLGEDGKPIRRDDGKILKGPNYKEPDLSGLI